MKLAPYELQLVAAVADNGGITGAAAAMTMSKSSVSRELAALEARIGLRLLHRTTRQMRLTPEGQILVNHAREMLDIVHRAGLEFDALHEQPQGELRVTAPYAVIRYLLNPHIASFLRRYPLITLVLDPNIANQDLIAKGFDAALRLGTLPSSSMITRKLLDIDIGLAAAPAYLARNGCPIEPAELAGHDLLDLQPNAPATQWTLFGPDGMNEIIPVRPRLVVNEPGTLIDLIAAGAGIGPIPLIYGKFAFETGELVQLLPQYRVGRRPLHLLYPSRPKLSPALRAFADFVADVVAEIGP